MQDVSQTLKPNPLLRASCFSKLAYCWMSELFYTGNKRPLEESDVYDVIDSDSAEVLSEGLKRCWNEELELLKHGGRPSFLKALVRTYKYQFILIGATRITWDLAFLCSIMSLRYLLPYFNPGNNMPRSEALIYAVVLALSPLVVALHEAWYEIAMDRLCLRIRVACTALIYDKSLHLKQQSNGTDITGKIVNLIANDITAYQGLLHRLPIFLFLPLQTCVVVYLLWSSLGFACISGLIILFLILPPLILSGDRFAKLRLKVAHLIDERLRYINELISGMRIVKMYCWEKPFLSLVTEARRLESIKLLRLGWLLCITMLPYIFTGKIMFFASLLTFVLLGGRLRAEMIFPVMTMYNLLRAMWHFYVPVQLLEMAAARVATRRLQVTDF